MNSEKESSAADQKPVAPESSSAGIGLTTGTALGITFGVTIGILTSNLGLWIALGITFGVGIGAAFDEVEKRRGKPKD